MEDVKFVKSITLKRGQVTRLIENKYWESTDDDVIELHDDNLILNCDGTIYNVSSMDLHFMRYEFGDDSVIKYLQELICEHLNLSPREVIYSKGSTEEFEFKIRFAPNKEWQIVVCVFQRAVNNTKFLMDEPFNIKYNAPSIGIYKRLGDSCYYFRWFKDI